MTKFFNPPPPLENLEVALDFCMIYYITYIPVDTEH